jgi:AcrR family transcriptional regulator
MARVRRTQAERTATTRGALLDATVDCLIERGYRRVTTTEVAHRAGVSAGALLHHFPTKADLLCAAVGHLFDQRNAEFRKAMADLAPEVDRVDAAIDLLWSSFSGPTFLAWLELWVGARTDPEVAEAVVRLDREFMASSEAIFRELFAEETALDPALPRTALGLIFALMDGLALARSVPGYEPVPAEELLQVFKVLIQPALPTGPEREHA